MDNYLEINRANWDSRVEHHLSGYDLDKFRSDPAFVSYVVQFDKERLGGVEGLDIVHLQCHIGTDTLSLARLGAKSVTGVDFSPKALAAAKNLASELGIEAAFIESTVDDAVSALDNRKYDMVYTGIGALCWLPDIKNWATVVSSLLRPGGRLFIREGHPVLWALSYERTDGLLSLEYNYFESEGLSFVEEKSYVDHEGAVSSPESISFNHGLGEIITALINEGMTITAFEEHDSVPYRALGEAMDDIGQGEFRLRENPERLPVSYTLQARKN